MKSMKTHVIETFTFIGKLSDVYLFLDYALNAMNEPIVHSKALSKWMKGVPEMARDMPLVNKESLSAKDYETFVSQFEEMMKQSYIRKFNESKRTVLNLSLVMMCTILELFFEHVFDVIFNANSQTLLSLSKDKNITVEQFLKHTTYDDVLNEFIHKSTDHIIMQGTKEILKVFDNIGIKTNKVFSWSNFTKEVQLQFADWTDAKLYDIFQERHSIVHDHATPLQSVQELFLRQNFFTNIMINISTQAWHKFYKYSVILDVHEDVRKQIKASGGDPASYPPPPKNNEK
jgi:hypothetical protein